MAEPSVHRALVRSLIYNRTLCCENETLVVTQSEETSEAVTKKVEESFEQNYFLQREIDDIYIFMRINFSSTQQ